MKKMVLSGIKIFVICGILLSFIPLAIADAPEGHLRKIVVFDETIVNAPAQMALVTKFGGVVNKPLPVINALAVYLPPPAVEAVLRQPGVLRIDDDVLVNAIGKPLPPPPPEVLPWGVDRINADLAWTTEPPTTGLAVEVGIVDTGIDLSHPDLQANIKIGVNTINPLKSPNDDNGHGTHVAGTVAAIDNEIGVIGVGPQIYLHPVKVLGKNGSGWLSDVIEGIQWCINNQMQVINMSLGTYSEVQSFHDAIIAANQAGIVQVVAAGNDGVSTPLYPAAYEEVIAVVASNANDQITSWSNWGWHIDLTAPGADIFSTYKGKSYKTLSGTSMATPHVTGTAALVLTTRPVGIYDLDGDGFWNPIEVKNKLEAKAEELADPNHPGSPYPSYQQGAGLVRADLAIQ